MSFSLVNGQLNIGLLGEVATMHQDTPPNPANSGAKSVPNHSNPLKSLAMKLASKLKVAGSNPAGVINKYGSFLHFLPCNSALETLWGGIGAECGRALKSRAGCMR
jgi:hypothetical protein